MSVGHSCNSWNGLVRRRQHIAAERKSWVACHIKNEFALAFATFHFGFFEFFVKRNRQNEVNFSLPSLNANKLWRVFWRYFGGDFLLNPVQNLCGDLNFGHLNKFSIFAIYYYLFALQFCALQDLLLQKRLRNAEPSATARTSLSPQCGIGAFA